MVWSSPSMNAAACSYHSAAPDHAAALQQLAVLMVVAVAMGPARARGSRGWRHGARRNAAAPVAPFPKRVESATGAVPG